MSISPLLVLLNIILFLFFSVSIYLCFLLFLAHWKVCWLAPRQEKYAGKWYKKAAQLSLKYFGNSIAGKYMSPSAISINCFSSFLVEMWVVLIRSGFKILVVILKVSQHIQVAYQWQELIILLSEDKSINSHEIQGQHHTKNRFPWESNIKFSCGSSYHNQEVESNMNLQSYKILPEKFMCIPW